MKHIFENLKKYWHFVILILALLVVQAYCDLSLPDYTSNIIDVGIVNGGVCDLSAHNAGKPALHKGIASAAGTPAGAADFT